MSHLSRHDCPFGDSTTGHIFANSQTRRLGPLQMSNANNGKTTVKTNKNLFRSINARIDRTNSESQKPGGVHNYRSHFTVVLDYNRISVSFVIALRRQRRHLQCLNFLNRFHSTTDPPIVAYFALLSPRLLSHTFSHTACSPMALRRRAMVDKSQSSIVHAMRASIAIDNLTGHLVCAVMIS